MSSEELPGLLNEFRNMRMDDADLTRAEQIFVAALGQGQLHAVIPDGHAASYKKMRGCSMPTLFQNSISKILRSDLNVDVVRAILNIPKSCNIPDGIRQCAKAAKAFAGSGREAHAKSSPGTPEPETWMPLGKNLVKERHSECTVEVELPDQLRCVDHKGGVQKRYGEKYFAFVSQWWFTSGNVWTRAHVDHSLVFAAMGPLPTCARKLWVFVPRVKHCQAMCVWTGKVCHQMMVQMMAIEGAFAVIQKPGDIVVIPVGFAHAVYTYYRGGDNADHWCCLGGPQIFRLDANDLHAAFDFGKQLAGTRRLSRDTASLYQNDVLYPLAVLWFGSNREQSTVYKSMFDKDGNFIPEVAVDELNALRCRLKGTEQESLAAKTGHAKRRARRQSYSDRGKMGKKSRQSGQVLNS